MFWKKMFRQLKELSEA